MRIDFQKLYTQMHPDFFAPGKLDYMNDEDIYEELILTSSDTVYKAVDIPIPEGVEFKFADTSDELEMRKVQNAVEAVDKEWPQYFKGKDTRIYCAYIGSNIASFCIVENMGSYENEGQQLKIGGPGCVGTVPEYRRQGIGLKMVQNATEILFDEGYDISWIHYTGVGPWYQKLGYKPVLKWNKKGLL